MTKTLQSPVLPRENAPAVTRPIHRRLQTWVILAMIALGVGCRLRQYLVRMSYWNDEAFIVLNVMDHPASRMLGPLDYNQAAPPAFLWIERAAAVMLGTGEYALRLFPLLAGLAALGLFAVLAWRMMPGPGAVCAIGWFALAPRLVVYSAELKQYSSDALLAVALMLVAIGPRKSTPAKTRFLGIAFLAAAGVWLSHPAGIVFGGLSLALLWPCWKEGTRGRVAWAIGNGLVAASFVALYKLSIVREQSPFLYKFWANGFPPTHHPLRVPGWLAGQLYALCREPFYLLSVPLTVLVVLGVVEFWKRRNSLALAACLLPVALTVAAAFDRKYPFAPSRLTLYLLPGVILLCGGGAAMLIERLRGPVARLGWALPGVVLAYALVSAGQRAIRPEFRSHVRPVAQYVRSHRRPGETLYVLGVPKERHLELYCYWRHPEPPVFNALPRADRLPVGRFWMTFTFQPNHPHGYIPAALETVRAVARQVGPAYEVKEGAVAYLFERPAK